MVLLSGTLHFVFGWLNLSPSQRLHYDTKSYKIFRGMGVYFSNFLVNHIHRLDTLLVLASILPTTQPTTSCCFPSLACKNMHAWVLRKPLQLLGYPSCSYFFYSPYRIRYLKSQNLPKVKFKIMHLVSTPQDHDRVARVNLP